MGSVLLPTADAGVAAQVVVLAVATGTVIVAARRRPEVRLFAGGAGLFLFSIVTLRALH